MTPDKPTREEQAREQITNALIKAVPNAERSDRLLATINGLCSRILTAIQKAMQKGIQIERSLPTIENLTLRDVILRPNDINNIKNELKALLQSPGFKAIFNFDKNTEEPDYDLEGLITLDAELEINELSGEIDAKNILRIKFVKNLTLSQREKPNKFTTLGNLIFNSIWEIFKKEGLLADMQMSQLKIMRHEIIATLFTNEEPLNEHLKRILNNFRIPQDLQDKIAEAILSNEKLADILRRFNQILSAAPMTTATTGGTAPLMAESN